MMYLTNDCPLCGICVIWDTNGDNKEVVKIKTRRRSVVLVHKSCIEKERQEHEHIKR